MDLYFEAPHEFWMARKGDFPEADLSDDDRYEGMKALDWGYICRVIDQVVKQWKTATVEEDGALHFVVPNPPSEGEEGALVDWGRGPGMSPRTDPGDDLQDGRHRTAACWQHCPDMLLPIRSDILGYVPDIAHMDQEFAHVVQDSCLNKLEDLATWIDIDQANPINQAWIRNLTAGAFGRFDQIY